MIARRAIVTCPGCGTIAAWLRVTANSYDFRMQQTPDNAALYRALRYLGVLNPDRIDNGAWAGVELKRIIVYYRRDNPDLSELSKEGMIKRIVAFSHYDQVKKGNKRWKLLPTP